MRLARSWLAFSLLGLLLGANARAEGMPDPLRLVPAQADFFLQTASPRKLIDAYATLPLAQQLEALTAFRELKEATNSRRFYQMVAYFEKQLGAPWPELLDRLAGGGSVLALKYGPAAAPKLFVVQGTDEALLHRFVKIGLEVIDQELVRREAKERPVKGTYRNLETMRIGKDFHAAIVGAALLLSNSEATLHLSIDLHLDGDKKSAAQLPSPQAARKLLPPDPLAWLWLTLEPVHDAPQAKEVFALQKNDTNLTVLLGGWLDIARRANFLCAGAYRQDNGFVTTVRMPSGREGMPPALAVHVPPAEAGVLPLLEPKNVLFSTSFYLDGAKFWEYRSALLNDKLQKGLEEFDKNSRKFLLGTSFSKLLTQAGPRQRFVAAYQGQSGYQTRPTFPIPAFAYVLELREPEPFGKSLETILRGAALLAGTQIKLKIVEEKHGDVKIIGYRFTKEDIKNSANAFLLAYSPSFARVGDQFVASSTLEFCRELVDLLQNPKDKNSHRSASTRSRFYALGGAALLKSQEDQIFAQTILDRALPPEASKNEVKAVLDLVRQLGTFGWEANYGDKDFRIDLRWSPSK